MEALVLHLFLLLSCCYFVYGTSQGALKDSCNSMVPGHSVQAQNINTAPFEITLDKTSYNGSDVIAGI